jgi:hypothetical protein
LGSDGSDRIEACLRVLEDHGNLTSANSPHFFLAEFQQIASLPKDTPASNAAWLTDQTQKR